MATKAKARQRSMRGIVREAKDWPTVEELAHESGFDVRMIRAYVQRGLLEAMRIDVIRINPESWEAFLTERYTPGQY